ncbi:MAG: pentapeptide repeat-containing protein [Coleofasciculaceae cyanobacterium]
MRATEVLKQYAAGRRDFSGENLTGQSFKGKDLSGANFSEADIRGANFTNATLRSANFSGAKAGLQRHWAICLVIGGLLFSVLAGFASASTGAFVEFVLLRLPNSINASMIAMIALSLMPCLAILIGAICWGLEVAFQAGLTTAVITVVGGGIVVIVSRGARMIEVGAIGGALILTLAEVATVAIVFAGVGTKAFLGSLVGAVAGTVVFREAMIGAGSLASTVILFGNYAGWRALAFDERFLGIWRIGVAVAAIGGTSFRNADLTNADFTCATLKSTDFRNATLTRTRWHQAKMLDRVRPGITYLQTAKVRQLLITGQGQAQNFDGKNLRGVNLQGANLADASLIGANLSEANLQDADLSRAKLAQTQLDRADLTGATLTGAYIKDWGITSHTKLHGVRCEYVFMRVPTKEDPNPRRKPDNWNETFKDGDFADFIKPIVDTLDLYHNQDVDPRAIAISFKQLAENHPEAELEIVAMEKRGRNKFLLRAATAPDANHSEMNAEYFATYNHVKALAEREPQALLEEKDNRIRSLENMIATALQRPSFYVETYQNQGDTMPEASKNEYNFHGSVGSVANQGNIGSSGNPNAIGNATADVKGDPKSILHNYNYAPEQRQTLAEAAAEIQQLLKQLEQTNPDATEVEQKAFLTAAIPPTKRQKLVNALQEGGKELFKELMDNIYVNVAVAAIEGWQSVK